MRKREPRGTLGRRAYKFQRSDNEEHDPLAFLVNKTKQMRQAVLRLRYHEWMVWLINDGLTLESGDRQIWLSVEIRPGSTSKVAAPLRNKMSSLLKLSPCLDQRHTKVTFQPDQLVIYERNKYKCKRWAAVPAMASISLLDHVAHTAFFNQQPLSLLIKGRAGRLP